MALTTLQKDAILSNLPSVFANEEGRIKLAEYIIAGEISWEEIEADGSSFPAFRLYRGRVDGCH